MEPDRDDSPPSGGARAYVWAAGLSLLWLAACVAAVLTGGAGDAGGPVPLGLWAVIVAIPPVAVAWLAAAAVEANRALRRDLAAARRDLDRLLSHERPQANADDQIAPMMAIEAALADLSRTTSATAEMLARAMAESEPATIPAPASEPASPPRDRARAPEQPSLDLQTESASDPLAPDSLILALNFPDSEDDREGFAALKRALGDRDIGQLVRASQDVLTLLSQDGIYMDDLRPDRARPEVWRRFAEGARGRIVADLGGVRDRAALTLVASRMRDDTIFRDAAHHFLRIFDKRLMALEPTLSDETLVALADTRTGRAFMLLGRVAGVFD